jgi:hypothetical protein
MRLQELPAGPSKASNSASVNALPLYEVLDPLVDSCRWTEDLLRLGRDPSGLPCIVGP